MSANNLSFSEALDRISFRAKLKNHPIQIHDTYVERLASKVVDGLPSEYSLADFDSLSVSESSSLIADEPGYSKLAAALLLSTIFDEVESIGATDFLSSLELSHSVGLVRLDLVEFARRNKSALDMIITGGTEEKECHIPFEYFGAKTVHDRYLLKHPKLRSSLETPARFFLRVATALSMEPGLTDEQVLQETESLFTLFSTLSYLPSSPTLFNSGTTHEQLSSCFLLNSPEDSLEGIYSKYTDIALLSKYSGGIGVAFHNIRSRGSLIAGTNGLSNGIVPWLKTLDSSVAAVSQGSKRKGACCVYLENWHADIEEFLEIRDNTGDEARRTHNLNFANWVSDLFFKRLEKNEDWSLFDPRVVPHLIDLYGDDFESAYVDAENSGLAVKKVNARDLYSKMMKTLAQTGNGWITFKDASNRGCNQTAKKGNTVHLSNLCTEVIEVTNSDETAVCNLGSINLAHHINHATGEFEFSALSKTVRTAVRQLNRVIDRTFYSIPTAKASNSKWRPVGLGLMGLQDVFFIKGIPFDSVEARALSKKISEEIYYHALLASSELAEESGPHPAFADTRTANGELQFDAWGVVPSDTVRWDALRERIKKVGLRNSLIVAIAPTATIASIAGCYECIEPQVSNLFKRETMSGEFIQINKYLVETLKSRGLWTPEVRDEIKSHEGSVQSVESLPDDLKLVYRTVWETPMRSLIDMAADRGAFICQSQSLNLFMENPTIGALSSMYNYANKKKLKTTYYLRSRPATKINKTTVSTPKKTYTDQESVACSLESPESCEACQ